MPAPIPEAIKSKVIEQWLLGQSRDSIAKANNISTGAVSNIAKEYEERLGEGCAIWFKGDWNIT